MPTSISKSQASLLASGFLDSIGSNPELNNLELNETLTTLILLAGELIEEANKNLQAGGHISSGKLSASMKVLDPQMFGKSIRLDVQALKYLMFLNKGVKGTKGGTGEFSFKNSYPSKSMVNEIQKWIKRAGASSFNVKKPVSHLEHKRKSVASLNTGRNTAYAVARGIKIHGIKPTHFFDNAVKTIRADVKTELAKALKVDVINSLPKKLGDAGSE